MAEPFGIIAGAIGILSTFTACVDCFKYIQLGRHFGRDFQTDQLPISCARLRLTRYGESVNIYNDPCLGKPDATAPEIQTGKGYIALNPCALRSYRGNLEKVQTNCKGWRGSLCIFGD
jgi:hypothetical protein